MQVLWKESKQAEKSLVEVKWMDQTKQEIKKKKKNILNNIRKLKEEIGSMNQENQVWRTNWRHWIWKIYQMKLYSKNCIRNTLLLFCGYYLS